MPFADTFQRTSLNYLSLAGGSRHPSTWNGEGASFLDLPGRAFLVRWREFCLAKKNLRVNWRHELSELCFARRQSLQLVGEAGGYGEAESVSGYGACVDTRPRRLQVESALATEKLNRSDVQLPPVSSTKIARVLAQVQKELPGTALGPVSEDNAELLLALGASETQAIHFLSSHRKFRLRSKREELLPLVDLFQQHGLDAKLLFEPAKRPVLSRSVGRVSSVIAYLTETLGIKDLARVCGRQLTILGVPPVTLAKKVALLTAMGLDPTGPFLEKWANLLLSSAATLEQNYEGLQLIFELEHLQPAVQAFPPLLCTNKDRIAGIYHSLKELLGEERAKLAVLKVPRLLIVAKEKHQQTHDEMVKAFGRENALEIFLNQPRLLGQSWDNIGPKVEYFSSVMGRSQNELVALPVVLTYSLENRIKARHEALVAVGKGGIYSLATIFTSNNLRFEKLLGAAVPTKARQPRRKS